MAGVINAILKEDKTRPVKQRHTAKCIFERLKGEHGFSGGYTIVKDNVSGKELRGQEMFVPLVHPTGEAQADFGEALVGRQCLSLSSLSFDPSQKPFD